MCVILMFFFTESQKDSLHSTKDTCDDLLIDDDELSEEPKTKKICVGMSHEKLDIRL